MTLSSFDSGFFVKKVRIRNCNNGVNPILLQFILKDFFFFNLAMTITTKDQCWALAPLLAPPRHWRKLKKGGARRGGMKVKNWCIGSGAKLKWS